MVQVLLKPLIVEKENPGKRLVKGRLCQLHAFWVLLRTDCKHPTAEWSHGVLLPTVNNLNMLANTSL